MQRIIFGILLTSILFYLYRQIQSKNLELRHAIIWIPPVLIGFLFCLFPELLDITANILGFQLASNALMSLSILALGFIVLLQSIAIGKLKKDLRTMVQTVAQKNIK